MHALILCLLEPFKKPGRTLIFLAASLCAFSVANAQYSAGSQEPSPELSAKVIAWANANIGTYKQIVQFIKTAPKPDIPVPPEIDPPCKACGDDTKAQSETDANAWVEKAEEPEASYIAKLQEMDHEISLLAGGAGSPLLTSAAQHALMQFEDDEGFQQYTKRLASRLYYQKAIPMGEKYHTDPKRSYAGIMFLLDAARIYALRSGTSNTDDEALNIAHDWVKSIVDKINQDIFQGKKYNLCPLYAATIRQLLLLGGADPDMAEFQKTVEKIEKMMYFDVNLNLHVHVIPKDGNGGGDETWSGKAKLHLNIDFKNACYTPEYVNGGNMTITVNDFSLHDDEGNMAKLVSSNNYIIPLGQPKLNLCDSKPILDTGISSAGIPNEQVSYKGKTVPFMLLSAYLNIASVKNSIDLGLPMNASAPTAPHASASQGRDFANSAQQIQQLQQQIMAHSKDPGWISSSEGQAAMAQMQAIATGAQQDASAMNKVAAAQRPTSMGTLRVPWTNGDTQPVSRRLQATGDEGNLQMKITVQNAPQE